jgi:hypothetical protein
MKTFKNWPGPLRVCAVYLPILAAIFAWFWLASNGGKIDGSNHRDACYFVYLVIFPLGIAAFLIHLFTTLGTSGTFMWRFAIAFLSGVSGLLILHIMIATSPDGEAPMAYLEAVMVFCVFGFAGFGISTLIFYFVSLIRKRKQH